MSSCVWESLTLQSCSCAFVHGNLFRDPKLKLNRSCRFSWPFQKLTFRKVVKKLQANVVRRVAVDQG